MNQLAWLTLTTQCLRLQVLTLRNPLFGCAIDGKQPHAYLPPIMSTKDDIIKKLREAFVPESLDVVDESHLHEGHAGHRPGGETHFRVYIVSPAFEGKSRVERHRMVNSTLDSELKGSVHALAIKAQAPGENTGR
jgi:BolA family transcriptional regulator, general stress-responsive regulator